jgi:tRNA(Ile)-lysidine synthetase-like protein
MKSFEWLRFALLNPGPVERDFSFSALPPAAIAVPGSDREIVLNVIDAAKGDVEGADARDTLEVALIDWSRVEQRASELVVRNWRPGDRLIPAGHSHEQKVKTLFNEWRVPLWDRRNWPILCVGEKILWTRRFGVAAEFVRSSTTRAYLQISERIRI